MIARDFILARIPLSMYIYLGITYLCLALALLLETDSSAVLQTCHLQILFYGDVAYSLFLELEGIKDSKAVGLGM